MACLSPQLDVTVSFHPDLAVAQLRCMGGYLVAATELERRIEMAALEALCEISEMGNRARRDLGIAPDHRIQLEVTLPKETA